MERRRKDKQRVLGGHTCNTPGMEPPWVLPGRPAGCGTCELPTKGWQFKHQKQRSEGGEEVFGGMARKAVGREIMTVAAGSV